MEAASGQQHSDGKQRGQGGVIVREDGGKGQRILLVSTRNSGFYMVECNMNQGDVVI